MNSRPATQASKGRHLRRSAIAEAVASDPAQRGVASIGAPGCAGSDATASAMAERRRCRPVDA